MDPIKVYSNWKLNTLDKLTFCLHSDTGAENVLLCNRSVLPITVCCRQLSHEGGTGSKIVSAFSNSVSHSVNIATTLLYVFLNFKILL